MAGADLCYWRNLSQCQSVNRRARCNEATFEFCRWKGGIFGIENHEPRIISTNPGDLFEVIALIRGDSQSASGFQCAMNGIEKVVCNDTATVMTAFGPGIGKQ